MELPPEARRSLRLYNLAFPVIFLLLLPGALWRMWRRGSALAHFGQRLGRYPRELTTGPRNLWLQSISVGETLVALKLAHALHAQEPAARILLSVTTVTGFALIQEQAAQAPWLVPLYNPLDLPIFARRALDTMRPQRLIIIEGGIWPNLLAECYRRGIPASLVSARLSPRSARRFARFRAWVGPIFRLLDFVAVTDETDRTHWLTLGLDPARLPHTGSIKFDEATAARTPRTEEFRTLLATLGHGPEVPVWVAGSTHAGEEALLVKAWLSLRQAHPTLVLIITPRHVERTAVLERELASLAPVVRRSTLPATAPQPGAVLLVDTTGELRDWYTLATIVFVGKSLTANGGQNPAEPALLGLPVIFGPHMENFAALVGHLLRAEAALQVPDAAALAAAVDALLRDAPRRTALATRARQALATHQGATARTVQLLTPALSA